MTETGFRNSDIGKTLFTLAELQRDHLNHPCHPTFMPTYICLARSALTAIRECLEQGSSIVPAQREGLTTLLRIWETNLLPGYIQASIEALITEARLYATVHLPPEQFDVFVAEQEARIRALHAYEDRTAA